MGKLLKFLKPHAAAVFAVLCVLIVQAFCDLSLPSYTSDIVNVGIQQGGIDEAVPEKIGEDELEHLLLFVPSAEKDAVRDAYKEAKDSGPAYGGTVLELKEEVKDSEEELEELAGVMGQPMLLAYTFENGASGQAEAGAPDPETFAVLDDASRDQVLSQMEEGMKDIPDTMTDQAAVQYIRSVYEKLGMDMDAIQTDYILLTGGKMLALAALGMLASITVGLIASRVAASVGREARGNVFRKVVGFSSGEFDRFSTASLITRSTNDIQQIQMLTVMILRMVLYAPIMAVGGVWKVLNTNVDMTWIIALGVALIFMVVIVLG